MTLKSKSTQDELDLRDAFAGQAMVGFMAAKIFLPIAKETARQLAAHCYALADAMLVERQKGERYVE